MISTGSIDRFFSGSKGVENFGSEANGFISGKITLCVKALGSSLLDGFRQVFWSLLRVFCVTLRWIFGVINLFPMLNYLKLGFEYLNLIC